MLVVRSQTLLMLMREKLGLGSGYTTLLTAKVSDVRIQETVQQHQERSIHHEEVQSFTQYNIRLLLEGDSREQQGIGSYALRFGEPIRDQERNHAVMAQLARALT